MKKLILILSILVAMAAHAMADNFVTDVMVIGGTQAETNALKTQYQSQGWTFVNQDLNQGAGGDYIYLLYKTDSDANPNATFITYFSWNSFYTEEGFSMMPEGTFYPVAYAGGSDFVASQGNLNCGTKGFPFYLYYTKDSNGGTDNPHLVKSISFNNDPEGSMPEGADFNWECGDNAPAIYMHPDITQGWVFWQGSETECIISAYDGPKAWITTYTVPSTHDGLNVIAANVFSGFINLETLNFWNNSHVTVMPSMQGCTNLKHVNVRLNNNTYPDQTPPSMTSIPDLAFYETAIEQLTMHSVTQVGDYAFEGCPLTSVTFNQSNVQIGNYAFANIGSNCTVSYSGSANDWSANAYVYSPNLVVNASDGGCGWCGGADGTSENNLYWTLVNGHLTIDWLWSGSPEQQVISSHNWNKNDVHSLTLNHVYVSSEEFKDYTSLTSVSIGNSVTSIGNNAFNGCTNLTSVHISDLAAWCNISFGNDRANPLYYAHHLYLNNNEIRDLVIPNSVTSIGQYAFQSCTGLTSVNIPNSVTSIGNNAFNGCTGLTSVHISDLAAWCNMSFGNNSANPLSYAHHLYLNDNEITNLVIPNSVTSIGQEAFYSCTGLTSVTIGNSVTSIGNSAFYGCTGLTSVHISDLAAWCNISFGKNSANPLSYAHHLYLNNNEIRDLVIPNSVTSIGNSAFNGCTGLTSVNIPNSVTSIGNFAFENCTGLTSVNIPNSVTSIGNDAFSDCSGLTSVTIPNSVTSIEICTFSGCTGLTSVNIGNGVTSIGSLAFSYCSSLKDLYFDGTKAQWNNVSKGWFWNDGVASDYKEHWRCTVTFNANGHGTAPAPQTNLWSDESMATQPAAPTEAGYVFTGWYTDAQCTTPWNFGTDIVPDDMTLYAGWDLWVQELQGSGTAEDPYLINNNDEWSFFAQSINIGITYADQTVKLAADITATVMAGSHINETNYYAFSGTFDGDGHTITLALSGSGEGIALFSDLNGATLKNLKAQGTVTTNDRRPATFAIIVFGNSTISNCWSTVAVSSTRTSDWIDGGGFVGRVSSNATLNMTDCAFHGSVTFTNGATTGGGMIGYTQSNATVNLTNCLYSPTSLTLNVSQYNPRIFVSGQESGNLTNCYYNAVAAASVLASQGTDASDMTNEELVAALGPNWTITDGFVVPKWILTFTKTIAGYGTGNGGWQFIASPVNSVNLTEVTHLFENVYDLYYFDQTGGDNGKEWKNRKAHTDTFTTFASGQGYLYANSGDVTLMFTGVPYDGNGEVTLTKTDGFEFSGWNLIGNPYATAATLDQPFYRMNPEGTALSAQVEANNPVAAMEGVFVEASTNNETATFTQVNNSKGGEKSTVSMLTLNLTRNGGEAIDNAIIRFDGGQNLGKFTLHKDDSRLYIPQDGEDYAIVSAEAQGELPLNFKARENGTYTLTISTLNAQRSTLHLIDHLTGNEVDLLQTPSYTFQAKTTDYASRFRLVFVAHEDHQDDLDNQDNFAFISDGNLIVNNTGTLQIFDILGHQLLFKELPTSNFQLPTSNFPSGVYVLRLINGKDVKTQKLVVK